MIPESLMLCSNNEYYSTPHKIKVFDQIYTVPEKKTTVYISLIQITQKPWIKYSRTLLQYWL